MELFDRRYKIYDAIMEVTTNDINDFNENMWLRHHKNIASAPFLFNADEDVLDFINNVNKSAYAVLEFVKECAMPLDEEQRQTAIDLCNNLWKLRPEAQDVFSKYLTLKA